MKMEEGEMKQKNRNCGLFRAFQMISVSLLSVLVPLSFIFLSRLSLFSCHLLTISNPISTGFAHNNAFSMNHHHHPLHRINVGILYTTMSSITIAALIYTLSGKTVYDVLRSRLYICWIVLFAVQASIEFGIRGTMLAKFENRTFLESQDKWVWIKVLFFLGLHEVMLTWFRVVVKPVVDDTIFGEYTEELWSERAVVAVTFGTMWWWKLRNETEGMVVVAELKHKLLIGLEVLDYVNWWMYCLCVVIGFAKVLRCLLWAKEVLLITERTRKGWDSESMDDDTIV